VKLLARAPTFEAGPSRPCALTDNLGICDPTDAIGLTDVGVPGPAVAFRPAEPAAR